MNTVVKKIQILEQEIDLLKSRIKEHGTGHIHTAINVIQDRLKELYNEEIEHQKIRNKPYMELND